MQTNQIYCMDNVQGMKQLDDKSIDLTVTSPPYDNLRKYNGLEWNFEDVVNQLFRITKAGGEVVWVVGDATVSGGETGTSFRQALYFIEAGFNLYDTMIYQKENPTPKNHRRYEQSFEYMFVFSKGIPTTFNPILIPCSNAGKINRGSMRNGGKDDLSLKHGAGKEVKSTKIKGNIWSYKVGGVNVDKFIHAHPAIFPEQLVHDHISTWTLPGDIVLDPFSGAGTTAKVAKILGRKYVGFEISQEYVDISNKRLANIP